MNRIKQILLLIFLFFIATISSGQTRDQGDAISVDADVIGNWHSSDPMVSVDDSFYLYKRTKDKADDYLVLLTLTNIQDSAVNILTMSCSWEDTWFCSNDSIVIRTGGCDWNFPTVIQLKPQKKIRFYGVLNVCHYKAANAKFRLGFAMVEDGVLHQLNEKEEIYQQASRIYWSKDIELKNDIFKYIVEE